MPRPADQGVLTVGLYRHAAAQELTFLGQTWLAGYATRRRLAVLATGCRPTEAGARRGGAFADTIGRMTGQLVLLAGPAGAGKSTLAKAWCATRPVAAHLQLDEVRGLIVSGLVDPLEDSHPDQPEQWRTAVGATCALATSFAERGVDVVVDDVLEPSAAPLWSPLLGGLPARLVVILPSLDAVLERGRSRSKDVPECIVRRQHQESRAWPAARTLDTTGQTVTESLARLLQLLDRADSVWP